MDDFQEILEEKGIKYYFEKYKMWILLGIFVFLIIIICTILLVKNSNEDQLSHEEEKLEPIQVEEKKQEPKKSKYYKVDIKGEVLNPSVYELEENSRIIDVIYKAGGLTEKADTSYINLSKKITDEMVIIIYSREEVIEYQKKKEESKYVYIEKDCECPDEMNEACIEQKKSQETTTNEQTEDQSLVSINKATLEQLQTLSGIGKSKAESIISYRKEHGDFKTIEELKDVSGIGDSVFDKIKDKITI